MTLLEEKLKRLSKESENELKNIGLGSMLKKDINYTINYKAKKRLGQCCNKKDINISSWLLEIATEHDIKNTIIHEILHTFEDTIGHKEKWQYYANYVNTRTNYHIKRLANIGAIYENAKVVPPLRQKQYKWEITCEKCGKVFYRQRMTTRTLNNFTSGNMVHKSCGGNEFRIVDLNSCEVIW